MKLTRLEKSALLKKAGIALSLLEGSKIYLQEMGGTFDPEKSPDGEWDNGGWYGGPNSGGHEGYYGTNKIHRVSLSSREFVILEEEVRYQNLSTFRTNHENNYPDGDCPCCGTFYYVFASEGAELDEIRVHRDKLKNILEDAEKHIPESLEMFREEFQSL